MLEKNKLNNSKIASYQEKFSKESPPVTPNATSSNNSHSYPSSSHNNGNNSNGNSYSNSTHNTNSSSTSQLTDLQEELKMMKGIIIKHENRIRELEKKLVDQANAKAGTNHFSNKPALKSFHDNSAAAGFLPDEV